MSIHKNFFILGVIVITAFAAVMSIKANPAQAVDKKAVYYCPMHPSYTSDRPGDCPICNMKLVKKDKEHKKSDICYLHKCPHAREGKPCPMLIVAKEGEKVECPMCKTQVAPGEGKQARKAIRHCIRRAG
jgi:hypothetical protein